MDKILGERQKLEALYEDFFNGLNTLGYQETMVMTFPYWQLQGKSVMFEELPGILSRNGYTIRPPQTGPLRVNVSDRSTFLYARPGQTVGREITIIERKLTK